jgi:hypothetical protein
MNSGDRAAVFFGGGFGKQDQNGRQDGAAADPGYPRGQAGDGTGNERGALANRNRPGLRLAHGHQGGNQQQDGACHAEIDRPAQDDRPAQEGGRDRCHQQGAQQWPVCEFGAMNLQGGV